MIQPFGRRDRVLAAISSIMAATFGDVASSKEKLQHLEEYTSRGKGRGSPSRRYGNKQGAYNPHEGGGVRKLLNKKRGLSLHEELTKMVGALRGVDQTETFVQDINKFYSRNPRPWRTYGQLSQKTRASIIRRRRAKGRARAKYLLAQAERSRQGGASPIVEKTEGASGQA